MIPGNHPHSHQLLLRAGAPLDEATGLVILLHGRGSPAANIIQLALQLAPDEIGGPKLAFLAPQANGNTWYPLPYSVPVEQNEPFLSSALATIDELVDQAGEQGLHPRQVALLGFSQGASLSMEYLAQGRRPIGAIAAFAGALIGDNLETRKSDVSLQGSRVFVGVGADDQLLTPTIVERSARWLETAGADLEFEIYPGVGHSITAGELAAARKLIGGLPTIGPAPGL